APFVAVELRVERPGPGQTLHFRTNVDDWGACGDGHALRFEPGPATGGRKPHPPGPRGPLGRVKRARFLRLPDPGEGGHGGGAGMFGVVWGGEFFAMAPSDTLKDLI